MLPPQNIHMQILIELNANGMVDIKIGNKGKWYLRTTYMQEVKNNPEYNWESFWATLTFEVK